MHALTFKVITAAFVAVCTLALVLITIPSASASAPTKGDPSNYSDGGYRGKSRMSPSVDNRPYVVVAIRSCVSAHVPSGTGSTTPSTITKEKGDALISCIKNARQKATSDAVAQLLKKIEELRAQIEALNDNS